MCGDLLIEQAEMASLLTEPLEELINQYGAFSEEGRVSVTQSCHCNTTCMSVQVSELRGVHLGTWHRGSCIEKFELLRQIKASGATSVESLSIH